MLGIDIGDNCDGRRQLDESAVGFICLNDDPFPVAEPGISAIGVDDAAIDDSWVQPAGIKHRGDQRRCGCLAMGAADRDGPFEAHQFGQHFSAAYDGDQFLAGRDQFRVVGSDGR